MIRTIITISCLAAYIGLVAFLFSKSADNGAAEFSELERTVRTIDQRNTNLDSAVLSLRLGLVQDYDELTQCELDLQLPRLPADGPTTASELHLQQTLRPLLDQKVLLAADFKASHSVVRNSVAGFHHYCSKALKSFGNLSHSSARKLARLQTTGSRFVVSGSPDDKANFEAAIKEVENGIIPDANDLQNNRSLALTLQHAKKLVERRIELDDTIETLVSIPIRQQILQIMNNASATYQTKSRIAGQFRLILSTSIVLLLGFCFYQFVALWKHKSALYEANVNLEHRVSDRTSELAAAKAEAEKLALVARYTDNAVVITDDQTRIEWVNDGFTRITGYEADEVIGKRPSEFLQGRDTEEEKLEIMRAAVQAKRGFDIQTINYRKNGEPFWVDIEARPIKDKDGKVRRFIAIESDITDRVNSEIERQQLNEQLVDASRTAGMAEMATGVLHNVGNILNSVNVSTNLIRKQFQKSALINLEKITNLIAEHDGNFEEFVRLDERGQKIPAYFTKLNETLQQQHQKMKGEFQDLIDNVEHIKEIVSVQQSMAKSSGVMQDLAPRDLIHDSITANKGTLANHNIKIVQELDDHLPTLISDKHKILQILINLIKNGKDALVEQNTPNPELKISVSSCDENIVFRVSDNGVGISQSEIDKIFNHGFTTKKSGHGFGLHSSANAATELGGTLTVSSDGIGRGAVFELSLPAAFEAQPAMV